MMRKTPTISNPPPTAGTAKPTPGVSAGTRPPYSVLPGADSSGPTRPQKVEGDVVGKPQTPRRKTKAKPAVKVSVEAALDRLETLRTQGQTLPAVIGLRNLVRQLDDIADPTPLEQASRLTATRLQMKAVVKEQCTLDAELLDAAGEFSRAIPGWFRQKHWIQQRRKVVQHYVWLIDTELRVGRPENALELFAKARKLVTLDPQVQEKLTVAASKLGLQDLGSAILYIKFLQGRSGSVDERQQILDRLRQGIRIDLTFPTAELLAEHRKLNDQLWSFRKEAWVAGHRALAAWRNGNLREAWAIRRSVDDPGEADAQALTHLGIVAYLTRAWTDAVKLFRNAAQFDKDPLPTGRLYLSLAQINQTISDAESVAALQLFLGQLDPELTALAGQPLESTESLDGCWVLGVGHVLLGRHAEALAAFGRAPSTFYAWRHAEFELEAAIQCDQLDPWLAGLERRSAECPRHADLARLLRGKLAAERHDWESLRDIVCGVEIAAPADVSDDPDPAAVHQLLTTELELASSQSISMMPVVATAPSALSPLVRAWLSRQVIRWRIERGEFDLAAEGLAEPCHLLAPERDRQRLEAARLALSGADDQTAGELLTKLGTRAGAAAQDRLTWGLWLVGQENFRQARSVLSELVAVIPDVLELRLARAEVELAGGGDIELARQLLQEADGPATPSELVHWKARPRSGVFRPWQKRVPTSFWNWQGELSPHRVGDMLHAARLMLRAALIEQGLAVVALVEQILGTSKHIDQQLGEVLQDASLIEMRAGNLERACELQARAARRGGADPDFALHLTEELETSAALPSDAVLAALHEWIARQAECGAVEQGPVGKLVQRLLHIDAVTPRTPADVQRFQRWTQMLRDAQPGWNWPPRNLAREAARGGRHDDVLRLLEGVEGLVAEDRRLLGQSAWTLQRFELAQSSFSAAIEAGMDTPDLRAWRGCATMAVRFRQMQRDGHALSEAELIEILPVLRWEECEPASAPHIRAWHGAVLIAAGRSTPAIAVLDCGDDGELRRELSILRGLALIHAGQTAQAVALWTPDTEHSGDDPDMQSLRGLALFHSAESVGRLPPLELARQLIRCNASGEPFWLVMAHRALADDKTSDACEALARAAGLRDLPVLLSPLVLLLNAERRFLEARLELRQGHAAQAQAAFAALQIELRWPGVAALWHAISLLEGGQVDEGQRVLEELTRPEEASADALAQLALVFIRSNRVPEGMQCVERALRRNASHPLATLAQAEAFERRGDLSAARDVHNKIVECLAASAGPRLMGTVLTTLGRLEWEAGDTEAAEQCFRQAAELRPDWSAAADRLALVLAARAYDGPRRQEAVKLLDLRIAVAHERARLHLAAASVTDTLGWKEAAAGHLRCAVAQQEFRTLPADIRQESLSWSVNLHLQLQQYGAAGTALNALAADGGSADDRIAACWLLEVMRILRTQPLTQDDVQAALDASHRAREAAPGHALAALLSTLCRLLRHGDDAETRAQALGLRNHHFLAEQSLLAAIVRHLCGDETAFDEVQSLKDQPLERTVDRHLLALLLANQRREPDLLIAEAESLIHQRRADPLPWSHDDVVLLRALDQMTGSRVDEAVRTLTAWHELGCGTARTRLIHSQLLARQAILQIKKRNLAEARRLLAEAGGILSTELPHQTSPSGDQAPAA